MSSDKSNELRKNEIICCNCLKKISFGNEYHYNKTVLCEECCIDIRSHRPRKTHWQYIGSVKGDYLIPGKNS